MSLIETWKAATTLFKSLNWTQNAFFSRVPGKISVPLNFKSYGLMPQVQEALTEKEIYIPTNIQDKVIPHVLNKPNDLFFAGQTGTGKTMAYAIPICNQLKRQEIEMGVKLTKPNRPRAIIVQPNKELTLQTHYVFKDLSHHVKLKVSCVCGGFSTAAQEKIKLSEGTDVLVTTMDRMSKHILRKNLFFTQANYVVFDEFDTFLDAEMGNEIRECIKIVSKGPDFRKLIFLGATYTSKVRSFVESYQADFKRDIDTVIDDKTHLNLSNLQHHFILSPSKERLDRMKEVLDENKNYVEKTGGGTVVFCNSVACCRALDYYLKKEGYSAVSLHGEMPNKMRIQSYERFRRKEVPLLISSDLGSRGLDFTFVNHVINFDFPKSVSDYLHRAGRAGRAGRSGKVTSIHSKADNQIVNELKKSIANDTEVSIKGSSYALINKEDFSQKKESAVKRAKPLSPQRKAIAEGRAKRNQLRSRSAKQLPGTEKKETTMYTTQSKRYSRKERLDARTSINKKISRRDAKKQRTYEKLKKTGAVYRKRLY